MKARMLSSLLAASLFSLMFSSNSFAWDVAGFEPGDCNYDGVVDLLDVEPFTQLLTGSDYVAPADCNFDGSVDLLDVQPFLALLHPQRTIPVLLGDMNMDNRVDLLDVEPFVEALATDMYMVQADINQDGMVNLRDVNLFVNLLAE